MTMCRGVRGATTATANDREAMLEATRELLRRLEERNQITPDDIAAAFFTVSDDLDAEYPALAARQLGWTEAALMCAREIPVPTTTVARCIRVLLLVNTEKAASEMRHVYLRGAVALRPSRADISVESGGAGGDDDGAKSDGA
ncbi:MAG TPA: chorismate mutase [Ktedonobacterales bacterium]|jgi:monofunctional chorismate mutase|nr:chorismate mutase [Ktedonobacterales bacterium]HEX5572181.1 chorismate mutase [Ktedonobacterales bacterium]